MRWSPVIRRLPSSFEEEGATGGRKVPRTLISFAQFMSFIPKWMCEFTGS